MSLSQKVQNAAGLVDRVKLYEHAAQLHFTSDQRATYCTVKDQFAMDLYNVYMTV